MLGGCAIGLSFGVFTLTRSSTGISADTVVSLALPALVTAFVFVAYLAARRDLNHAKGTVIELNTQLIRKEIELGHLSSLDELTGLYARRQFDEQARLEFERSRRYTRPLALILIEIDDLHVLGESVGRLGRGYLTSQVSEIIRARLRVNDIGGRYTSDALALLLPDSAEPQAISVADKIRGQVQVNSFMGEPYDKPLRLTLSIGIVVVPCDGIGTYEGFEQAAEQALTSAKGAGRDSLCVHGSREPVRAVRSRPDLPLAS